jgi:hypothetical protein
MKAADAFRRRLLTSAKLVQARFVRLIGSNTLLVIASLANLVFLFLPFYDSNNIPLSLAVATHFDSNVPAFSVTGWAAGPFINAAYVPMYLSYVFSGFSLYWSYTTLKLIYFVVTCSMAWCFYTVLRRAGRVLAQFAALACLANPLWFYLNYVWVEFDIIPVAFLAISYVLLRYGKDRMDDVSRVTMATACLFVSIFFYWFALAALPALLFYSKTRRERGLLLVCSLLMGAALAITTVWLLAGSPSLYLNTLLGHNSALNRSAFFGLQYYVTLGSLPYLGLLIAIVFVLPFLLYVAGSAEELTIFVVLSILVYSSSVSTPDNYMAIFPFALLLAGSVRPGRRTLVLAGLLLLPATGLVLISFFIGAAQPSGIGVFYWGYDIFHANVVFLPTASSQQAFLVWYNRAILFAVIAAISVAVVVAVNYSYQGKRKRYETASRIPTATPAGQQSFGYKRRIGSRSSRRWIPLVAVLILASLVFNLAYPNIVQYSGAGSLPLYAITPSFWPDNGNVPRPIEGKTFTQQGSEFTIATAAPPIVVGRWFHAQTMSLTGTEGLAGAIPSHVQVIYGNPFNVSLWNTTQPDSSKARLLSPTFLGDVTNQTLPIKLLNQSNNASYFDGYSTAIYNVTESQFVGSYLAFAFNITHPGPLQTDVFNVLTGKNSFTLVADPHQTLVTYGGNAAGGTVTIRNFTKTVEQNTWYYVVIHPTQSSVAVNLSGETQVIDAALFDNATDQLRLGVPFPGGGTNYSFGGLYSNVLVSNQPPHAVDELSLEVTGEGVDQHLSIPNASFAVSISGSSQASVWSIGSDRFTSTEPIGKFYTGKFQVGAYSFALDLSSFSVTQVLADHFYLLPVFWTAIVPYLLLGLAVRTLLRPGLNHSNLTVPQDPPQSSVETVQVN